MTTICYQDPDGSQYKITVINEVADAMMKQFNEAEGHLIPEHKFQDFNSTTLPIMRDETLHQIGYAVMNKNLLSENTAYLVWK